MPNRLPGCRHYLQRSVSSVPSVAPFRSQTVRTDMARRDPIIASPAFPGILWLSTGTGTMFDALLILFGYLLGSVSSAIVVCRLAGLPDPRSVGSGNPGATNVLRVGTRTAAAATLAGDLLKGLLPVLAARALEAEPPVLAGVALAAFLGHLYPVFFGFRGGKGVATAFGCLLGIAWGVALAVAATWLVVAKAGRISSLAALAAAVLAPLYTWWLAPEPAYLAMTPVLAVLLIWRHRSNIRNLLRGTEGRIGQKG